MPAAYAHKIFGLEVLIRLSKDKQEIIQRNIDSYYLGLHGPDVLFYYQPLKANKVSRVGFQMHEEEAYPYFEHWKNVYLKTCPKESYLAYLYGFLCHFSLDSTCHPLVQEKIDNSDVTHTEIESSFDRMLLEKEKKDPLRENIVSHIKGNETNIENVSLCFKVEKKVAKKAISSMLFYNKLLKAPSKIQRGLVNTILKITNNYQEVHGMMIPYVKDERCSDSDQKLYDMLYGDSLKKAVELIDNYALFLEGKAELDNRLHRNYEA